MLHVRHVCKSFAGRPALRNVSLAASRGEAVGLVGRNGAGKSTLMRLIAGTLNADSGSICLDGAPRLGFLPEGAPVYGELSPRDALAFVLGVHGLDARTRHARITTLLEALHLEPVADRVVDTLSKGYQRRTALAMALAPQPDVLILDEPFDGFDPIQKRAATALLNAMVPHTLLIVSTHTLDDAARLCSRLVILEQGAVLADMPPQALQAQEGANTLEDAFCARLAGAS